MKSGANIIELDASCTTVSPVSESSINLMIEKVKIKLKVYNLVSPGVFYDYQLLWRYQKSLAELSSNLYKINQHKLLTLSTNHTTTSNDDDDNHDIVSTEHTDYLILVQHKSIYTLGRGGTTDNLRFQPHERSKHEVVRVERGGEVTWHGPGQIVAYPIFNLHYHKKDLHWFTRQLEQTVINTLQSFDIDGHRSSVNSGVWVGKDKISAVGLTASRWVTMHGIALNVDSDIGHYKNIIPCGIDLVDHGVCSMQQVHDRNAQATQYSSLHSLSNSNTTDHIDINLVAEKWIQSYVDVFFRLPPFIIPSITTSTEAEDELTAVLKDFPHICSSSPDII